MARSRHMALGVLFNHTGNHVASWRHPEAQADAGINVQHYLDLARAAEAAKFDFIFLGDMVGLREGSMESLSRVSATSWISRAPKTSASASCTSGWRVQGGS